MTKLAKALESLPHYVGEFAFGMLTVIITDVLMTSLFIGCVFLALLTNLLIALAVFFLTYTAFGSVTNISITLQQVGMRLIQTLSNTQRSYPVHPPQSSPMGMESTTTLEPDSTHNR